MTDRQWDDIFKNKIQEHESHVPVDMWERISRKKDRDRKGFFFFFSLIGLFLLGFGTAGILLFGVNRKENPGFEKRSVNNKITAKPDSARSMANDQLKATIHSPYKQKADDGTNGTGTVPVKTHYHSKKTLSKNAAAGSITGFEKSPSGLKNSKNGSGLTITTGEAVTAQSAQSVKSDSAKLLSDTSRLANPNPVIASTVKTKTTDSTKNTVVKKAEAPKKTVRGKWSVDLYASPDYPIDYSDNNFKSSLSYTIGLRVNRSFGKHFSGRIGIQYSQLNIKFYDSLFILQPLRSFDLPVLAGYSWGNENFGMTVNTGIVFNLTSWLNPGSPDVFKTNTGLSLYMGFQMSKQISDRLDIFAEPYYRYRLSSMTVSTVDFLKFIDVAGISFGAQYHFFKK